MLPEKTLAWGLSRSCIRELAEYGARRKAEIGAENVYDFSLGNPSVPSPEIVNASIAELIKDNSVNIHGYTTAAGILSLREKLAADLNSRFGLELTPDLFYVTCGAAASLTVTLKAILFPGDEVITVAPFFPEYRVFVEAVGGVLKVVPAAPDFQIDLDAFEKLLSDKTKAVIINSPNNPSGAVFSEDCIKGLAAIMKRHEEKTGETLYLISDEPYREIVYGDITVPCTMNYYDDAIICYSFSKSLSVPGERIGYIAVSNKLNDCRNVYASIMGAGRSLGYVNPPSLFQRVIERSVGQTSDISEYQKNRDLLCNGLKAIGYEYVEPQGAFYLFVKALEPDALAFSERAKKHELLLVPSDDFGCTGYVRLAYCVATSTIEKAMPAFKALFEEYQAKG
ncbi:MAG: pyridoxal phosphate-dependent aminotransferase [Lachnospiraceae bacterium]|nr:pyridoxal phosphate-dependent aminotransferase [Lachnospiraceae bacterium]